MKIKSLGSIIIEIVIITIGVTISFSLNEWKEARNNKKHYKEYLTQLQYDLAVDSLQIAKDIISYQKKIKGAANLLSHEKVSKEELPKSGNSIGLLLGRTVFLPNDNTYRILQSTGSFVVFPDKELVKEIVQLYQHDYPFIDIATETVKHCQDFQLSPVLHQKTYFSDYFNNFQEVKTDLKKLLKNNEFQNAIYLFQSAANALVVSYQDALESIRNLQERIKMEKRM